MLQNSSSAAVMIGAFIVNIHVLSIIVRYLSLMSINILCTEFTPGNLLIILYLLPTFEAPSCYTF